MPASGHMCGQERTTRKTRPLSPSCEHLTQVSGLIAVRLYPPSCPRVTHIQILGEMGGGTNELGNFAIYTFETLVT